MNKQVCDYCETESVELELVSTDPRPWYLCPGCYARLWEAAEESASRGAYPEATP